MKLEVNETSSTKENFSALAQSHFYIHTHKHTRRYSNKELI